MKIAIFGGAFDPFHTEHKKIITACKSELGVDRVIVVPSYSPPHKACKISPYDDRYAMVKAGTADLDYVTIDNIEKERNKVNPTSTVLPLLKAKYPCEELFFVIGGDSMVHFHTWIYPEIIAKNATLAVVARSGVNGLAQAIKDAEKKYNAKIILLNFVGEEVSSSVIKASVELGLEPQNLQKEVIDIIAERGLYTQFKDIISKLKSNIPEKTFLHVSSTALYAMRFVTKLKLNYEKVFLACILHDCTKHLKLDCDGVPAPVVHQFTGADCAKNEYGIVDEDILNAIRYHTSGKPGMTALEQLVYVADMLEPRRHYDGVEILRSELDKDFDKGFYKSVEAAMAKLKEDKNQIYPLTKSCLAYYTINKDIKSNEEQKNDT